jgi:hypothetical protein
MNLMQLFSNPKIMQMLQILSNSSNPRLQMDAMFANNPKYAEFKQKFEGKSDQEIIQYFNNALGEQGINLNGLINTARQFGLIK